MKNTGNVQGKVIAVQSPSEKVIITVVQTEGDYPKTIPVKWLGKSLEVGKVIKIGQSVEIEVYISGSEWNGKYFADIVGHKITSASQDHTSLIRSAKNLDELAAAWRSIPKEERTKDLENAYKEQKEVIEFPIDDLPF